ncbi:hypothetical protein VQ643_04300 [Pseudomonas sp. F1_0610]|uniref:hypothetical protein n=1 Tax=Pseudomonas sp. F1_0610 TaxID=3114284 RepID=UPI0039C38A96
MRELITDTTIPTNDVFHHLLRLLQIHRDKDLVIDMFAAQGITITKSKLKRWDSKTGEYNEYFSYISRETLEKFIDECYKRKLVTVSDE